eukprot:CAMPEP_0185763380 /NCGR_PEP_ID=MMETSP1174-20130828/22316_1 /TAXON_ID=35687 /ORGANISM="Dictyocha speculum, Strain CCMP1381" /LENGTH=127 /DNA_ID=CAMNT_0028445471 /DNA_START=75 /DNA_END=458 /DNA_ORIENTATION=+
MKRGKKLCHAEILQRLEQHLFPSCQELNFDSTEVKCDLQDRFGFRVGKSFFDMTFGNQAVIPEVKQEQISVLSPPWKQTVFPISQSIQTSWTKELDEQRNTYYWYNHLTGKSSWTHPSNQYFLERQS